MVKTMAVEETQEYRRGQTGTDVRRQIWFGCREQTQTCPVMYMNVKDIDRRCRKDISREAQI